MRLMCLSGLLCPLLVACSGDDDAVTPPPRGETGTQVETSTTGDSGSIPADRFASEPELSSPTAKVGGARRLVVDATAAAELEVRLEGPEGVRTVRWPAQEHFDLPIVGLVPDAAYTLTVVLDPEGDADERVLSLTGDPLPPNLPALDVLTLEAGVTPGYTLFATTSPGAPAAWLLLLDAQGGPVWWAYSETRLGDLRRTDDGTLLGLGDFDIVELDWLGTEVRRLSGLPSGGLDVKGLHHEVFPLPDGHLLTLDQARVSVDDLPQDYDDLQTQRSADVADNGVVVLDAAGGLVERFPLVDVLPTSRIGFNSLEPVAALGGAFDWAHANGVVPHPEGGFVVCLRHQDAVVKLDDDGQLDWILGDPAGWTSPHADALLAPAGDVVWPYHPHAPEVRLEADGLHVLLFDNVNEGHTPYTPAPASPRPSRLVEYRVSDDTVEELWSFQLNDDGPLAAFALGDADRLDSGHVLGVWGMLSAEGGVPNVDQDRGNLSARIAEIDPVSGEVLFDLRVGDTLARVPEGWSVYRASRLSRLHPGALSETGP